ncbi:hypothetical protein [Paenibacillus polymyxa]|uniref:Uncharacterized protein n=1 Tax=Paenibacillus polymyxa TaxID=1406 RepID=A0ABX2ZDP8_PAEPO|nr:hypothetical protein [Paenibacillus polymyxa]ODA08132.1 hypothetical protein A7312_08875 [Paenibacillus polymyxa]
MAKKLTASELGKLKSSLNKKKNEYIKTNDGEEYEVAVSVEFRDSLIENVAMSYIGYLQELRETSKSDQLDNELIKGTLKLVPVLAFREFTNIPVPKKATLKEIIGLSELLADKGITEALLSKFPEGEYQKIVDKIKEAAKSAKATVGEIMLANALNQDGDKSGLHESYGSDESSE